MRWTPLLILLAGCGEKLPMRPLTAFASPEAWCKQLKGAECKGEWPGGKAGTSAQGTYRFVLIEASAIDTFGGGPSVSFELKTPHGFVYAPLGAIGATGTAGSTTLDIKSVKDEGAVLDLRTHARSISPKGMSDGEDALFFVATSTGAALANVHLGTNARDELGRATGHFGTLTWEGSTLISSKTRLKDGEYRVTAP